MRLLVSQPPELFRIAAVFLAEQRAAGVSVHVSDLVLAEAYFALQTFDQLSKSDAIDAIASFGERSGVAITPIARDVLTGSNRDMSPDRMSADQQRAECTRSAGTPTTPALQVKSTVPESAAA